MLENIIVAVAVLLAAAWIARRVYRTLSGKGTGARAGTCGACSGCATGSQSAKPVPIVTIGSLKRE